MNKWNKLRSGAVIVETLGKERLHDLGFNIPNIKVTSGQVVMLNRVEEELPSASDAANADGMDLQETVENAAKTMGDLITQLYNLLGDSLEHSLCKLLGLDTALRSIWGLLKVEAMKNVQLQQLIERKSTSSQKSRTTQNTMMAFKKTSGIRLKG